MNNSTINSLIEGITTKETYENSRPASAVAEETPKNKKPEASPVAAEAPTETPVAGAEMPVEAPAASDMGVVLSGAAQRDVAAYNAIKVRDGDTFDRDGTCYRIWGIDAPERSQEGGEAAYAALGEILKTGNVEIVPVGTDKYGRTVAKLFVDGVDVSKKMVEDGHAWHYEQERSDDTDEFRRLQDEARTAGLGVHASGDMEARVYRKIKVADGERRRWDEACAYYNSILNSVATPEMLRAKTEGKTEKEESSEKTKELHAVQGIADSVAYIANIGIKYVAAGKSIDDIPEYELGEVLRYMKNNFGFSNEMFIRQGFDSPSDAARFYIEASMGIVETSGRRQKDFLDQSDEEKQEAINAAVYGEDKDKYRFWMPSEVKRFAESFSYKSLIENAFANGATAKTVATGVMIALSEHQSEEQHRRRLEQMDPEQAKLAVTLAGGIRAQYDGNFAMKALYSFWNTSEALANNLAATFTGDAMGVPDHDRVLDIWAQDLEDTKIRVDGLLDTVATVGGSSIPYMGALSAGTLASIASGGTLAPAAITAISAAATGAVMAAGYADASRIIILEDWHDYDPGKAEAFKITYAIVGTLIERIGLDFALKPISFGAKHLLPRKLGGMLSTKTLAMKLAGAEQKSAMSNIIGGMLMTGGRTLKSAWGGELLEETATQALLSGGGMFVDPRSADGRKLYNLERFTDETIDAAWTALITGPFITAPFAMLGVADEHFRLKTATNLDALLKGEDNLPNILEFHQQSVNAIATADAKMRAETLGGLSSDEVIAFSSLDKDARKKHLESLEDKGKKKWLGEIDTYLDYEERFNAKGKQASNATQAPTPNTQPGQATNTQPVQTSNTGSPAEKARKIADNPDNSSERDSGGATPDENTSEEKANNEAKPAEGAKEEAKPEAKAVATPVEGAKQTPVQKSDSKLKPEITKKTESAENRTESQEQLPAPKFPVESKDNSASFEASEAKAKKVVDEEGLYGIANEVKAAYGRKQEGAPDVNPRLVEIFKDAIKTGKRTGVGIMDVFSRIYDRTLQEVLEDPDSHESFRNDVAAWSEAVISKLIQNAKRHKKGDKVATEELERQFLGDGEFENQRRESLKKEKKVDEYARLREFANFAKKWLRSTTGAIADIYFVEDLEGTTNPDHKKALADYEKHRYHGVFYTKNGNVYISKTASPATILHEVLGHATWTWLRENNKHGYEKARELAVNAPESVLRQIFDKYIGKKLSAQKRAELWDSKEFLKDDEFLNEVFAHVVEARYKGMVDKWFNDYGTRTWYEKIWDALKDALRNVIAVMSGSDTSVEPEVFMDGLAVQFFGHKTIVCLNLGKMPEAIEDNDPTGGYSDETPLSEVSGAGEAKTSEELEAIAEQNAKEEGEKASDKKEDEPALSAAEAGVSQEEINPDVNEDAKAFNPKGKNIENLAGLTDYEESEGQLIPSTLKREEDEYSIYDMRNTLQQIEDAIAGALRALGFNVGAYILKVKDGQTITESGGMNRATWENDIAKVGARASDEHERKIFNKLVGIMQMFGGNILHSKVYFTDEDAKYLNDTIAEARKILDEREKILDEQEKVYDDGKIRIGKQIDAVEQLVGLATINSTAFLSLKDRLGSIISLLRPSGRRISFADTDLTNEDIKRFVAEEFDPKYTTGADRILQEAEFDSPQEDPIRTGLISSRIEEIFLTVIHIKKNFRNHPNKYVREFVENALGKLEFAEKVASEEFRHLKDVAYMQEILKAQNKKKKGVKLSVESVRQIAFSDDISIRGKPRETLREYIKRLHGYKQANKARLLEKRKESEYYNRSLAQRIVEKAGYAEESKFGVYSLVRILEADDIRRHANDPKKPPFSDEDRKLIEDKLEKLTKIPESRKIKPKYMTVPEAFKDHPKVYIQMLNEANKLDLQRVTAARAIYDGYKAAKAEGKLFTDSDSFLRVEAAFAALRAASLDDKETLKKLRQELKDAQLAHEEALKQEGYKKGPKELIREIRTISIKRNQIVFPTSGGKTREEVDNEEVDEDSVRGRFRAIIDAVRKTGAWRRTSKAIEEIYGGKQLSPEEFERYQQIQRELDIDIRADIKELGQFVWNKKLKLYVRETATGYEDWDASKDEDFARQLLMLERVPDGLREAFKTNRKRKEPLPVHDVIFNFLMGKDIKLDKEGGKSKGKSRKPKGGKKKLKTAAISRNWHGILPAMTKEQYEFFKRKTERSVYRYLEVYNIVKSTKLVPEADTSQDKLFASVFSWQRIAGKKAPELRSDILQAVEDGLVSEEEALDIVIRAILDKAKPKAHKELAVGPTPFEAAYVYYHNVQRKPEKEARAYALLWTVFAAQREALKKKKEKKKEEKKSVYDVLKEERRKMREREIESEDFDIDGIYPVTPESWSTLSGLLDWVKENLTAKTVGKGVQLNILKEATAKIFELAHQKEVEEGRESPSSRELEYAKQEPEAHFSLPDDPVEEYKNAEHSLATGATASAVMYMAKHKKQALGTKEAEDIVYSHNKYLGDYEFNSAVAAVMVLSRLLVVKYPEIGKMSNDEIYTLCDNEIRNMAGDTLTKITEMLDHIQSDEWRAKSKKFKSHMARLANTGRLLEFKTLSDKELADAGVGYIDDTLKVVDKGDGYEVAEPKYKLGVSGYLGLAKKVHSFIFKDKKPSRESIALYRNTLVEKYGEYGKSPWLKRFFTPDTSHLVRRLVAQMRDFADTIEQIDSYAKRIETALERGRTSVSARQIQSLIMDALEPFKHDYDAREAVRDRKVSANVHARLHAMYEGMSMISEELDKAISDEEKIVALNKVKKELEGKVEASSKDFDVHSKGDVGDKGKSTTVKENASKAAIAQNRYFGYKTVLSIAGSGAYGGDTVMLMEEIYDRVVRSISQGVSSVKDHIEAQDRAVNDFVADISKPLNSGKSGEQNKAKTATNWWSKALQKISAAVTDGFTLKQRFEDMARFLSPEERKVVLERFDSFINTPIAKAESVRSEKYLRARVLLDEMTARVYLGGTKDKKSDWDIAQVWQELNVPIEAFRKFSANGEALTRGRLMAQCLMISRDDVQAPFVELKAQIERKEISESDLKEEQKAMLRRIELLPEAIEALKKISDGKDLDMMNELIAYYKNIAPELDAASAKITGAPITPDSDNLFPVRRSSDYAAGGADRVRVEVNLIPKAITPIQNTTLDIAEDKSIFDIFKDQAEKDAHFLAFGDIHYRLVALLENNDFTRLSTRLLGKEGSRLLKDHLQDTCSPNLVFVDNSGVNSVISSIRKFTSIALLGGNALVALKQTTSIPAFSHEIGWTKTVKSLVKNWDLPEMKEAREFLFNSPEAKLRWKNAYLDIQESINERPGKKAVFSVLLSKYMALQRWGDFVPSYFVAPGVYLATKKTLLSRINPETGNVYTEQEASDEAKIMVFDTIEKTQQTSRVSNMSHSQRRGNALSQLWTQFQSSPALFFGSEVRAIRDFASNPSKETGKALLGNIVSNHVVLPSLLFGVEFLAKLILKDEEPDEKDLWQLIFLMLSGPLSGFVVIGNVLIGSDYGEVTAPAVSFIGRGLKHGKNAIGDTFSGEFEEAGEDVFKLTKSLFPAFRHASWVGDAYFSEEDSD